MIDISTSSGVPHVRFPYNDEAVAIMHSIPGRRWEPAGRFWIIRLDTIRLAATRFHAAGFDVTIDGIPWEPTTGLTQPPHAPLVALFRFLPERLRQPAYRALSRVLHPDTGGDDELMKALNRAMEENR
jgi:hypothetical protein